MQHGAVYPEHINYTEEEIIKIYEALSSLTDEEAHMVRNKLIENNLRLVLHIARDFSHTSSAELQDLVSIGNIGLIKAVNTYDYTKETKLATYAARCITNEILMYLRANKKHCKTIYFEDVIYDTGVGDDYIIRAEAISREIKHMSHFL